MPPNRTAFAVFALLAAANTQTHPIVDTGQTQCFDDQRAIAAPKPGAPFFGQDAQHQGRQPSYTDNGTVIDRATGLVWQKADSGEAMDWQQALAYAEQLRLGRRDDWRLPNAKELQSLVDFTRAPDAVQVKARGPAIDPLSEVTEVQSYCGTRTTHLEGRPEAPGGAAVDVGFGEAFGFMVPPGAPKRRIDVHGAGAQRSDPKSGDPGQFPAGRGPQGDDIRIVNCVRCVRDGGVK